MKVRKLDEKTRGWFVGNFDNAIYKCEQFEVAVKRYKAGDSEQKHVHKVATELSLVVEGEVIMNGVHHYKDDIIILDPGDATDFKAVVDTIMCVVKIPSVMGDKYLC